VEVDKGWNVEQELENHQWADIILLQTPVNWMGVPWVFKKYMDEVYTAGMGGALCNGDGRTEEAPKANYGNGGTLQGKKYLLSLTFNAPEEAFNNPEEYLFRGASVDDLLFPMHMNFRFFGMEALNTFACYDVMKNPQVESDFQRFRTHLGAEIPTA
jgi:modulator of drug activity B